MYGNILKYCIAFIHVIYGVGGTGLLILYRPKDLTGPCVQSSYLRFDLSFGMGMSDTITLVFRTYSEIDYTCVLEIVSDDSDAILIVVIRYPTTVYYNCENNPDAILLFKRERCVRVCDLVSWESHSPYFQFIVHQRMRFRFNSNSSINAGMEAHLYQITVTTARRKPGTGCHERNETLCTINKENFCFTSGVVCDGIKNCGVEDAFDERKSECLTNEKKLGVGPVIALVAVFIFLLIAGGHLLAQYLPPLANSFFIFNANEDNRLCIDPVLKPSGSPPSFDVPKKMSIIPVSSSTSSEFEITDYRKISQKEYFTMPKLTRTNTLKSVTERLQSRIKFVTSLRRGSKSKTQL